MNAFYRNITKKYIGRSAFVEIRSLHIGNFDELWKAAQETSQRFGCVSCVTLELLLFSYGFFTSLLLNLSLEKRLR